MAQRKANSPDYETLSITLHRDTKLRIRRAAEEMNITMSFYVTEILNRAMREGWIIDSIGAPVTSSHPESSER